MGFLLCILILVLKNQLKAKILVNSNEKLIIVEEVLSVKINFFEEWKLEDLV